MEQQLAIDLGEEFNLVGDADISDSSTEVPPLDRPGVALMSSAVFADSPIHYRSEVAATQPSPPINAASRTQQLEQALAQCQRYIDDLKVQLTDQELLMEQLATTEEFSHIQKQAIITLQGQLEHSQQLAAEQKTLRQAQASLESELTTKNVLLQAQAEEMETLKATISHHQAAVDRFKDQTDRLSSEIQLSHDTAVQETQQRIVAQRTAERLRKQLQEQGITIQILQTKLQQSEGSVSSQQEIIHALKQTNQPDSHKNQAIQGLSTNLLHTQARIAELEAELSHQSIMQAQYQHSMQEFEATAQSFQARSQELEQQVAEMQEQILQQAQQASEYETAVQHWKDRCLAAEQGTAQLKQVIERLLCDRSFPEGLSAHQLEEAITDLAQSLEMAQVPDIGGSRRGKKLDLPTLVHRWRHSRSYSARSSE